MAKVSKLILIPPLVFAALGGLLVGGMLRENAQELPSTFIGQKAPALPEAAVPGTRLLISDDLETGDVTVVNFWASWCPPCRAEHPMLLALAGDGVRVAGVNFRDTADQAAAYLETDQNPFFATGFDPRGRRAIDWGVSAPPETFIVGGDGTVLYRFTGPLIGSDYEQRFLPELMKAMGQ
jgi:cytochrome c biogenesis protein CcmG/thiol:disulfide interchange protein DsbE